ncbi:MAG: ribulose-phosphate 3-epimerase [Bacteroidia bacterium]|nr:ribulose-phosphate 3-epimerase [Bacteroidia bacterium]MCO5253289.1 ribulose-phosphate 3-epimerase [Bacteroidota bacterium]MCZ2130988.1 ribulose-phosphate 3-epimerase [Bacteroidia bacterium]
MSHIVAPSILSANFGKLNEAFEMINQSQADWFHVDVMDGVFVPNISFGFPVIKALKKVAQKPLDVHLMIVQPERYIDDFAKAGADILTVHYEASTHLHRTLSAIKEAGMKAGIAINPHTPISSLKDILYMADLICMMSVNPGFGGQKFIENTYNKIKELKAMSHAQNLNPFIEIDGGVTIANAKSLLDAGANALVAGNTVFSADNPLEAIVALKNA